MGPDPPSRPPVSPYDGCSPPAPRATPAAPVLVACSGGADSLALLAATVFEARERPWPVSGSPSTTASARTPPRWPPGWSRQMATLGVDETASIRVTVAADGHGLEAAARQARYAVLEEIADRYASATVLLGHTRDDQAETVLLGLTRGSGGRSLAGMRRAFGIFRRPLLDLTRDQTEHACRAEGIEWWTDPANDEPAVHPLAGPPHGAAAARDGARAGRGRDPGPDRRPAARRHRAPRRASRRRRTAGSPDRHPSTTCSTWPPPSAPRVLRLAALGAGAPRRGALPRARPRRRRPAHRLARPGLRRPARPRAGRTSRRGAGVRELTWWTFHQGKWVNRHFTGFTRPEKCRSGHLP